MSPRAYSSPLRDAEAAATRARIVEAAAELFVRDGYTATRLKAVAARAGVSLPTVHLHGPKPALLVAAFERAFAGDEGDHSLLERPALRRIVEEQDDDAALTAYADFLVAAQESSAALSVTLEAAAASDEAVREAAAHLEARRLRDMRLGAGVLAHRGLVPPARVDRVADVLGYVTGPHAYLHLVRACGWSPTEYRDWLVDQLHHLIAVAGRVAP